MLVAANLLREVFNKVLDEREALRLDVWRPLAENTPGEKTKETSPEAKREKPSKRRRRRSKPEKEGTTEVESPRSRGRSEGRKRSERSRSRKRKKPSKRSSSSPIPSGSGKKPEAEEKVEKSVRVKKEPTEAELDRRPTVSLGREVSPVSHRGVRVSGKRPTSSLRPAASVSESPARRDSKAVSTRRLP